MTDFVVVGAGLVGCFMSLLLAKTQQGERRIFLYEKRKENTFNDSSSAKTSINLALSARGLKALQNFPRLYKQIIELSMPMYGRMYHHFGNGKAKIIPYSIHKSNCLLSIERNLLHCLLLGEIQKKKNQIELHFNCDICQINLKERWICVKRTGEKREFKTFDFLIGADGFNSIVRKECHFEFLEIDSNLFYQEIKMEKLHPDDENWKFQPFLHIWPAANQMSVALPNKHKNPTCTLFTQNEGKYHLRTILSLQSNKGGHCALIGDAAHTLLPFYGQGINAGFEDACLLEEIFVKTGSFATFTQIRFKDSKRIFLLSMDNFYQMNRGIQSKSSMMAHWICIWLDYLMPQFHFSLYRMISFTCIPYEEAYQRMKKVKFTFSLLFLLLILLTLVNKICFG